MFKVTDTLLFFSKTEYGEDRTFFGPNSCGVIDGATPIDAQPFYGFSSQTEWFVEKLKLYLESEESISVFPNACDDFIREIKSKGLLDSIAEEYNLPAATVAAVTQNRGVLQGFSLGDCGIIVKRKNNSILKLFDTRVSEFSKLTINEKKKAMSLNIDFRQYVRKQMIKNRDKMNTQGGFWTVAPKGDFSKEFLQFQLPESEVDKFILYTDGLEQICDMCRIDMIDLLDAETPSDIIKKCIEETVDRNEEQSSHIKKIDDIGFIVAAMQEER